MLESGFGHVNQTIHLETFEQVNGDKLFYVCINQNTRASVRKKNVFIFVVTVVVVNRVLCLCDRRVNKCLLVWNENTPKCFNVHLICDGNS